jgi:4'-phosphopantetheinyl transferase
VAVTGVRWPLAWPADEVPRLEPGETHVWRLELDSSEPDAARLAALLSADERARADAFRFERHRSRYVGGRSRLRELLAAYVGEDARALGLVEGPNGKPELTGHDLRFNLAHSESLGICAVSTAEVGVDVEVVERERRPQWEAMAKRFFHGDELRAVDGLSGEAGWREFLRTWTLKEACLKATGLGLLTDPASFSVAPVLAGRTDVVALAGAELRVGGVEPLSGAVAALATSV